MRIAAVYDIHGNLPALEAVLAEVEREAPDAIVVGGDIAPMLEGVEEAVVVCGHTHRRFDRRVGGKRVVNAGAVGNPEFELLGESLLAPTAPDRVAAYFEGQA
jgi:predicted phosphodiesterase